MVDIKVSRPKVRCHVVRAFRAFYSARHLRAIYGNEILFPLVLDDVIFYLKYEKA